MSLAPPPFQAWDAIPSVWQRWFQALFLRVGGSTIDVLAPLASPVFTGDPRAPTPAVDDSDTSIATTAFVLGQAASTAPLVDGVAAAGTSTRHARADHVHPTDTSRAPVASPAFTGTPTAPTAPAGTNTAQIATTAFVATALASPAWNAPTLLNSWVNFGFSWATAGYYKDALGVVHLKGLVALGTGIGSLPMFTLPTGYRPAADRSFAVQSNFAFGAAVVTSSGDVIPWVGDNTSFSLDGILFRAGA